MAKVMFNLRKKMRNEIKVYTVYQVNWLKEENRVGNLFKGAYLLGVKEVSRIMLKSGFAYHVR